MALSIVPFSEGRTPASPFARLDARIIGGEPGLVYVGIAKRHESALMAHMARRARQCGRMAIVARSRAGASLVQDIALRLGISELPFDVRSAVDVLAEAARKRGCQIFAPAAPPGSWEEAVARELAGRGVTTIVLVGESSLELQGESFLVGDELSSADKVLWLGAVALDADAITRSPDLATLEGWWRQARHAPPLPPRSELSEGARAALTVLAVVARPWPCEELANLGIDGSAFAELKRFGAIADYDGFATITATWLDDARRAEQAATAAVLSRGAEALAAIGDPFARLREAQLLLRQRLFERADRTFARAIARVDDAAARRSFVAAWAQTLAPFFAEPSELTRDASPEELAGDRAAVTELRLRAAERALAAVEAEEALFWARGTGAVAEATPRALLVVGRAHIGLGDLTAAKVALEKARLLVAAEDRVLRGRIATELAEIAYLAGHFDDARREAALAPTEDAPTLLRARNILGKILLAEADWTAADAHFAEDALTAAHSGDDTARMRALLNRGIALLSKGHVEDARSIFEQVLAEGERTGDGRGVAYALSNLAVVATQQRRYGEALTRWERTAGLNYGRRDRIAAARTLTNLAELRCKLGLLGRAEEALAFARNAIGPGITSQRASRFSIVAAKIALARGRTDDARRYAATAVVDAESSSDVESLSEALRIVARIALEDGDVARARETVERARPSCTRDAATAELALLAALCLRAAGDDALSDARQALVLARKADDEEISREAHTLLAQLLRERNQHDEARAHIERATALRDEVARTLSGEVREAYLAKPETVALERLSVQIARESSGALDGEEAPMTIRVPSAALGTAAREIVGEDPQIRALRETIRKVARSSATVLVRGESGTGKELVAEALHREGERKHGPLITVNCAALVETLLLSELFGHEKGAFTGALARRRGRFELAEGGTLFLDEIGDISSRTQVALLRVLQEKTFERVGGTAPIRADVRVVCATHRDLRAMVDRGEFREDLYYRLRGLTLEIPPLRARLGDLGRLAESLLTRLASERNEPKKRLAPDALALLSRHKFPGNVRELENMLRAVTLLTDGQVILAKDLLEHHPELRPLAATAPDDRASAHNGADFGARSPGVDGEDDANPGTLQQGPVRSRLPANEHVPARDGGPPKTGASEFAGGGVANVREEPSLARLPVVRGDDDGGELPPDESDATAAAYRQIRGGQVPLADIKRQIERDCIARALDETRGNITRAAALLGMKRPRLSQLVKQYGLVDGGRDSLAASEEP